MGLMYELSPHPQWVKSLQEYIRPYWNELLEGEWGNAVAKRRLTVPEMQGWILQLYPFIHAFPKFLAEALIKVEDEYARSFLIDNIRVEKAHAEHWIWMGQGFGLRQQEMLELADGTRLVLRDVQSLTDWLWYVNTKGTLAEAVAATSFAIEGVTGDLSRTVIAGFESYRGTPGVDMNPKTYKWMREHARYDDEHPKIALEIVKRYAITDRMQTRAMLAAKRSLQLLHLALNTSYRAYSFAQDNGSTVAEERRASERRQFHRTLAFPDRRFGERRGRVLHSA
jgi:pyrroloquinoline quinone (PQQ) biosynthesis protein C